jgi:hypothetical protein
MSVKHRNSATTSFSVVQIDRDLCAKSPARARFPRSWAASGWFEPVTIYSFPFFLPYLGNLYKILEI